MKPGFITALLILAIIGLILVSFGCAIHPAPVTHRSTPSAPVVASQEGKDATVVAEAAKIDAIAPEAKEHTDAQRAAVAAAPASDVKRILAEKDAAIKALEADNARLAKENADLKDATLKDTARWIVFVSLGIIGLSILYVVLSPNKLSALMSAGPAIPCGILGLALAQLITRPWFMTACGSVGVAIAAACSWWAYQHYKAGTLAADLTKKSALAESTLGKLVPAIDHTYDQAVAGADTAGQAVLTTLFAKLSSAMNSDEKAVVHTVRANLKTS